MATITLAPEYGYTVIATVASIVLVTFLGSRVTMYRDVAKVPLPFLYADAADCQADPKKHLFNCYQRVHQNTLEGFSSFLATLMFAGLWFPIAAPILGLIWCLGRIFYFFGYTTGRPRARLMGVFGHIGEFGLLGLTGYIAYDILASKV
ncbi:Microsomal glutathione S-transferase 3 [Mortierella alpina]|nr:Microsomal glutathione S-transferase 3 [Mortierella alpina]